MYGELGSANVHVTVVCPSFFATNILKSFRSAQARQRTIAQNLFGRSKTSADDIAAQAIKALETGSLYVVPQADARFAWWMKRLSPACFFRTMRNNFYSKIVEKNILNV